jgi:hypothetical protein
VKIIDANRHFSINILPLVFNFIYKLIFESKIGLNRKNLFSSYSILIKPNEPEKIVPIKVRVKLDGGPMFIV